MSFRFRKSVKLTKGVRLNVSKRGVGVSVGTRGLRHSVHSSGRRTSSIGVPGTGLSYLKTSSSSGKRNNKGAGSRAANGSTGNDMTQNASIVEQYNNHIFSITNLHRQSIPEQIDWIEIKALPAPFSHQGIGPLQTEAVNKLHNYTPNFIERMFKKLADNKQEKLKQAIKNAEQQDKSDYQEWEELTKLAENVMEGNPEAYEEVVNEIGELEKIKTQGFEVNIANPKTLELEFQINTEEVVPTEVLTLTKTGKLSQKVMGKTLHYGIMKDHVCSYALYMARLLFANLPIDSCVIHVKDFALNTSTGNYENRVLLSVLFDRIAIEKINFEQINPSDAMVNFRHHMDHLKTKGFRPVERITQF